MSVPALRQCQLTPPTFQHGATAAAQVPFLNVGDPNIPTILAQHGFSAINGAQYAAADGSWIQFNAQRNMWERGVGNVCFRGRVTSITAQPAQPYTAASHRFNAIGYLPAFNAGDLAGAAAALTRAGFTQMLPSYFSHSDGSWVALLGGGLEGGLGNVRLQGFPAPGTGTAPAPGERPKFPTYTSVPYPNDWPSWRNNIALAKLPRADGGSGRQFTPQGLTAILTHLGFVLGQGGVWTHPDGSRITQSGGLLTNPMFQRWGFGNLPYQTSVHWNQWSADTTAWVNWAQNQSNSPPFARFAA